MFKIDFASILELAGILTPRTNYCPHLTTMTPHPLPNKFILRILGALCAVVVVAVQIYFIISFLNQPQIKGVNSDLSESVLLSLINLERTKAGIQPLKYSQSLQQAALAKAEHMISTNNFNHYYNSGENQISPWKFVLEANYQYHYAGENLARHFFTSESVLAAWLDSPSHRQNILNSNYTETGIAIVDGDFQDLANSNLIVQFFASPVPAGYERIPETEDLSLESASPVLTGQVHPKPTLTINPVAFITSIALVSFGIVFLDMLAKNYRKYRHSPRPYHWKTR